MKIKWALIKVVCSDGQTRLGMDMEDDCDKSSIVVGGLHEEYASAICDLKAEELGIEVFNNMIHEL